jgi:hypothetical protein
MISRTLKKYAPSCLGLALLAAPMLTPSASGQMVTPIQGSNLTSSTTFTWQAAGPEYMLYIGTSPDPSGSAPGPNVYYGGFTGTNNTSVTVNSLPTGTTVVHVDLWTKHPVYSYWLVNTYTYNLDADADGVPNTLDPNPATADPKTVRTGTGYTLTVLSSGRVAHLEHPTLFNATKDDMSFAEAAQISNILYTHFKDDFDFILIASDQENGPSGGYAGIHMGVKNDTAGIGLGMFNYTAAYGSGGKLQSIVHLIDLNGLRGGPSLHEIMHRWGNNFSTAAFPSQTSGHWGNSSVGGVLGGFKSGTLEDLGGGEYRAKHPRTDDYGYFGDYDNGGNSLKYSPFELYMMGLVEASATPTQIQFANNLNWLDYQNGIFEASSITTIQRDDLIATPGIGVRTPGPATSQKSFRILYVILGSTPLAYTTWSEADQDVYDFDLDGDEGSTAFNFWEATGGLATVKLDDLDDSLKPLESFRIKNHALAPGAVQLTVPSQTGYEYVLWFAETLGSWYSTTPISGTGSDLVLNHNPGTAPNMFYKVVEQLPSIAAMSDPLVTLKSAGGHTCGPECRRPFTRMDGSVKVYLD